VPATASWSPARLAAPRDEDDPATFRRLAAARALGYAGPYLRQPGHDLAALNKTEMLLWDGWGLAELAAGWATTSWPYSTGWRR
jgi:hypothetical protein